MEKRKNIGGKKTRSETRDLPSKHATENVLMFQGGGSLGAYECGVFSTLCKHDLEFDIVSGTSIGAVNAFIIAASSVDNVSENLENFWIDLAERITPNISYEYRSYLSSMGAATWGNPNSFVPESGLPAPFLYHSFFSPFLYTLQPLKETLQKYTDLSKLKNDYKDNSRKIPRLIVTSVDIQKSKTVTFDSKYLNLDHDHILASAGYPFYGIKWVKKDGMYLWDGSLASNTPLREIINASPKSDKHVYIVNLFPRVHNELPANMAESWHRARDIMHTDKTQHNVRMSKVISKYLDLLNEMHYIISNTKLSQEMKERFDKIETEYHKLAQERGAIIRKIVRIERKEESHFIFEDADFSEQTIKNLISQGKKDAQRVLEKQAPS